MHSEGGTSRPRSFPAFATQPLYQLVRVMGDVTDHTFEIRCLGPGATAYSFILHVVSGRSRYDHHDGLHSGTLWLPQ
jgi:hypothetical protein